MSGCICTKRVRKWIDGHCTTCDRDVSESQLMAVVRIVLQANTGGVWWRNNIGVAVMDGHRIAYGLGNPGGADLVGLFLGRFVAVEIKTPRGRQSPEQAEWQRLVESKGGIYAIVRSESEATELLRKLSA